MPKKIGGTKYYETAFGIIPRSKLIPLEIEGIKRAWDYLLKERKSRIIKLDAGFVKKLHKISCGWIFPEHGGKFRKKYIKALQFADNGNYKKIEKLIKESFLEAVK